MRALDVLNEKSWGLSIDHSVLAPRIVKGEKEREGGGLVEVKGWVFAHPRPPPGPGLLPVPQLPDLPLQLESACDCGQLRKSLRMNLLLPGPGEGDVAGDESSR